MKRDSLALLKDNTKVEFQRSFLQQSRGELISCGYPNSCFDIESNQNNVDTHSKSSFSVAIRFRPTVYHENNEIENNPIWELSHKSVYDISRKTHNYFDHVFDENATNQLIYDKLIKDAVKTCLSGINVTIFAYGQTSSGKTHTMFGDNKGSYDGVVPLSINEIFSLAHAKCKQSVKASNKITVSYLEVYNEKLFDLLVPQSNVNNNSNENNSRKIKIIDGVDGAVDFVNLTTKNVSSPEDVHAIIKTGLRSRRVAETTMNERSSRSHTILRIKIESQLNSNDTCVGILNFVDLAGSESIKRTQLEGDRRKEGMSINRSLLALSQVISQLSEIAQIESSINSFSNNIPFTESSTQSKNKYINYRDSKITRILSDSLGGNSRTIIICNCSPDRINYYETLSTIDFARRAKKIQNQVKVNILKPIEEKFEIIELKQKLSKHVENITLLKQEVEHLKSQKDKLSHELKIIKNEQNDDPSRPADSNIKLNNCFCPIYKEQFDHLLAEYAEIIDLKSQNINNLNEEINSLQLKCRNAEKLIIENDELRAKLDIKNNQIIKKENEIEHLSKLYSELNHQLQIIQTQLECKDSVIERLMLKNEKTSLFCVELKKKLDNSLFENFRFMNWYISGLKDKKLHKTEYINTSYIDDSLEFLFSIINDYINFTYICDEISKHDKVDYNLEFSDIKSEIALLESEINYYEAEKNKVDSEIMDSQIQTIKNLNLVVIYLFELLCSVTLGKNNYYSIDNSIPSLSISDSYEFKRKIKDSERLIKVLESELCEKKEIDVKFKILQLEIENVKKENISLSESLEAQRQENKELKTSVEQLKHELKLRSISSNIFHSNAQKKCNYSDYKASECNQSIMNQSSTVKSNIQTSIGNQGKPLQIVHELKENISKENINSTPTNYSSKERTENLISNSEESHITECNTQ